MTRKKRLSVVFAAAFLLPYLSLMAETPGVGLEEKSVEDVMKKVFPSVVKVEAINSTRKVATGVVIDKEGSIVTTALISPRDQKIMVTTADGKKTEASFLGMDLETHLALIQTKEKGLTPITIGKSGDLAPGAWIGVVSISPENTPSVTQGIVSSVSDNRIRLNVWVIPGSSGSPVINREGKMVGLLRGIYADEQPVVFEFRERELVGSGYVFSKAEAPSSGMAVAVPVDIVSSVATEIRKKGRVERGWLGVSITDNDEGRVEIIVVEKQSPAELAKLREGDILLKIDGKEVGNSQMLVSEIRQKKPGQDIQLQIERSGKKIDVKVKLGESTEEEAKKELALRFPRLFPLPEPPEPPSVSPEKAPRIPEPPQRERFFDRKWEKRKFIGIYLEEINRELSEHFGLKEGIGLLVTKVSEDSPSKKAGLKVGDVVFKADGKRIDSVNELSELIQEKKKGEKIKIEFVRDKKTMNVEVEVDEEETRGFSSWDWDEFVRPWGDYTDELQKQLKTWEERYGPEFKTKLQNLSEEVSRRYEELTRRKSEEEEGVKKIYSRGYWRISRV